MKTSFITLVIIALIPMFIFSSNVDPNTISTSTNSEIVTNVKSDMGTYDPIRNTRWGTDVQVYSGNVSGISYDYDRKLHNMYSLVLTNHGSNNDSINIYKSADFGSSWYLWANYPTGTVKPKYAKLLVVDNVDTPYVTFTAIYPNSGGDLYICRILESDSSTTLLWKNYSYGRADTLLYFDAACQDSFIYVALYGKDTTIYYNSLAISETRYNIKSNSWTDPIGIYNNPISARPAIAADKNGKVYVALLENRIHNDTVNIRLKRGSNYGSSWLGTVPVTSNGDSATPLSNISIAATNDTIVWVGFEKQYSTNADWQYYYSVDGGATYSSGPTSYTTGHIFWDQHLGTMAMNKSGGILTVALKEDSTNVHNVLFGWVNPSNPSQFFGDSVTIISDYASTNSLSPVACTKITNSGTYYLENSAVLYAGWGPTDIYFDGYNFSGIKERVKTSDGVDFSISASAISNNNINIRLNLRQSAKIKVDIYGLSGYKVKTLAIGHRNSGVYNFNWNRTDNNNNRVSNGIYLIRVSADNSVKTAKISIIK